jgi:hypothetical protein
MLEIRNMKLLKHLYLSISWTIIDFCENVDENLFEYLDPMVYNSLEFLNLGKTSVKSSIAHRLPHFQKLQYLMLDEVDFEGSKFVQICQDAYEATSSHIPLKKLSILLKLDRFYRNPNSHFSCKELEEIAPYLPHL